MRKVIKILLSVLSGMVLAAIILPVIVALLLNVGVIQNFAVRKAGEAITNALGTEVSIEHIALRRFSHAEIKGFYVEDLAGDTLIYAETLSANLSKAAIVRGAFVIGGIRLNNGKIYLYKPEGEEINIQGVLNTFIDKNREKKGNTKLSLKDIRISDTRFQYRQQGRDTVSVGKMNYSNLVFDNLNVNSRTLLIEGAKITMDLYDMSFTDIGGFRVDNMGARKFVIDDGLLDFKDTHIHTPGSRLELPEIVLNGGDWQAFSDYVNLVNMDVSLTDSKVSAATLSYFIPGLSIDSMTLTDVGLTFRGRVNDFGGELQSITFGDTKLSGSYAVKNVTDIRNAGFTLDIPRLTTDAYGVDELITAFAGQPLDSSVTNTVGRAGLLSMAVKAEGKISDFKADIDLNTEIGSVTVNAGVGIPGGGATKFDGEVKVTDFDAGHMFDLADLGSVSVSGKLRGGLGAAHTDLRGNLGISRLDYNGYSYGNIWINGGFTDNVIDARINSMDRDLYLNAVGRADLGGELPALDLSLDLRRADLHKLGLNRRDSVSVLGTNLTAQISGNSIDNINGEIVINNISYVSPDDAFSSGQIVFTGRNDEHSKYLSLASSFADAEFSSPFGYREVFGYLSHILYDYLPSLDAGGSMADLHIPHTDDAGYDASRVMLDVKETNSIFAVLLPGLSIAKGTRLEALFDPQTEKISLSASSDYVEYNKFFATKLSLRGDNTSRSNSLFLTLTTDDLYLPGFSLPHSTIDLTAKKDNANLLVMLSDTTTNLSARLDVKALLSRNQAGKLTARADMGPSNINLGGHLWEITTGGVSYDPALTVIDNFEIRNNGQGLSVNGVISADRSDTLSLRLNNLDVAPMTAFTSKGGYEIAGIINGYANMSSVQRQPLLIADITFDGMRVNDYDMVPLDLTSRWDFGTERASLSLTNRDNGNKYITGFYRPSDGAYLATVDIPALPLSVIEPLLSGSIKDTEGMADIDVEIRSNNNLPFATGKLRLRGLSTTVGITDARYMIPDTSIDINRNVARLGPVQVVDSENNAAELSAAIDLSNFSNISYQANLVPRNIVALDTKSRDNDMFYGKVYMSGAINLRGDKMGIDIDAVATTEENSSFFLALSGKSSISQADFVVFESNFDTGSEGDLDVLTLKKMIYERRMREVDENRTNININVALNVLPNTSVSLVLDREGSNVLHATGNGTLNMHINPGNNDFSMYGTYELAGGEYVMNLQPIVNNRKFSIQPGGTIQWTGEPADAMLNISAIYRLRASLAPILGSESGSSLATTGRIPIDCTVNITNRLSQPEISFEVDAPNADLSTQNELRAALATQEMMATQFLYLIAFNSFLAEGGSGNQNLNIGAAGTSAIGLELLTGQISNWVSNDKADFTLRYRPSDEYSSSEVDIGFSTDIIQNKLYLEVEGNVDTRDNPNAVVNEYRSSIMTGDASLMWVMNKSGSIRSKFFTRTIDRFDENQGLQETGVGIYYREDFNKFSDVINRVRSRSAARKQRREEKKEAPSEGVETEETGTTTVDAGNDPR